MTKIGIVVFFLGLNPLLFERYARAQDAMSSQAQDAVAQLKEQIPQTFRVIHDRSEKNLDKIEQAWKLFIAFDNIHLRKEDAVEVAYPYREDLQATATQEGGILAIRLLMVGIQRGLVDEALAQTEARKKNPLEAEEIATLRAAFATDLLVSSSELFRDLQEGDVTFVEYDRVGISISQLTVLHPKTEKEFALSQEGAIKAVTFFLIPYKKEPRPELGRYPAESLFRDLFRTYIEMGLPFEKNRFIGLLQTILRNTDLDDTFLRNTATTLIAYRATDTLEGAIRVPGASDDANEQWRHVLLGEIQDELARIASDDQREALWFPWPQTLIKSLGILKAPNLPDITYPNKAIEFLDLAIETENVEAISAGFTQLLEWIRKNRLDEIFPQLIDKAKSSRLKEWVAHQFLVRLEQTLINGDATPTDKIRGIETIGRLSQRDDFGRHLRALAQLALFQTLRDIRLATKAATFFDRNLEGREQLTTFGFRIAFLRDFGFLHGRSATKRLGSDFTQSPVSAVFKGYLLEGDNEWNWNLEPHLELSLEEARLFLKQLDRLREFVLKTFDCEFIDIKNPGARWSPLIQSKEAQSILTAPQSYRELYAQKHGLDL